jgi:tRNA pseudouridine13 synthase
MSAVREREEDDIPGRSPKRPRTVDEMDMDATTAAAALPAATEDAAKPAASSVLPPSHTLLSAPRHVGSTEGPELRIMETDVGISEYVGHDIPPIQGIIKQRWFYWS